jgi:multiple sugar transport system permease protein
VTGGTRGILRSAVLWAVLAAGTAVFLYPLLWMAGVSLSPADAAQAATVEGGFAWPASPQWENYREALGQIGSGNAGEPMRGFKDALANSVVIAVLVTVGTVLSSSLVALAFARVRFRGSRPLFMVMLGTMMLPGQVTMIPLFILFRNLGWIDTMLPLVVPAFFANAYFVFMYRQFIAQVPEALLEAARLDGLGWLGIWWRIILPLCRPVTAITAVFTFIGCWNDFLAPVIYLQSDDQATLSVALNGFRNQYGGITKVHLLMAASITTMVPCILLFLAAQRQFVEGLGKGAVKG